jgi:hypothetical protein
MSEPSNQGFTAASQGSFVNNVTGIPEVQRTPNQFRNGLATAAGYSALWNPTAGKKFRLLGGVLTLSKEAACAGAFTFSICDSATTAQIVVVGVSTAALVAMGQVVVIPFTISANGYLSLVINNVLQMSLSGALTAGQVTCSVWGTEE